MEISGAIEEIGTETSVIVHETDETPMKVVKAGQFSFEEFFGGGEKYLVRKYLQAQKS
jgi:hypothetical protein